MNLENVRREDWILAGLALFLIIDLLFFPWFSFGGGSVTVNGVTVNGVPSYDTTATGSFDGWLAILGVLGGFALLAYMATAVLSPQTQLPTIGGSPALTRLVLAGILVGFMVLKFLFHIHFSYFGWGFWIGVPVAAALIFFALQARNAEPAIPGAGTPPTPPPPPAAPGPPPTQVGGPPS